jgi:2'-5' RNA ligase
MAVKGVEKPAARLFFALWPDEQVRRQVARHQPREGRLIAPENWHITLLFIGSATVGQQRALELAAAGLDVAPFRLELDYLDYWWRVKLTWLGISRPPASLLDLNAQLKSAAEAMGFSLEARRYVPHLSLSRGSPATARQPVEAISWKAAEFCLVESMSGASGVEYKVRRRWPLQEPGDAGLNMG